MTTPYAGSAVFPTAITLPSDGEHPGVSSVNVPMSANRDAVVYLKARADALDGAALRNVRPTVINDAAGNPFDFGYTRADGSAPAFWCPTYSLWIKPGKNTVGKIYIGDDGWFSLFDTAATSPPKVSFGCDSGIQDVANGRVCLFDHGSYAANPKYIIGPASGDYTGTWTTKVLDANTYASFVRVNSCVATPTQRIIAVGGGDISSFGQFLVWKSDDNGNTFTRVVVANAASFGDYFTRVIIGAAGRLVAWIDDSSVNQGSTLWYSDDNGDTWSSRTGIGFDHIKNGVYLSNLGLWFFVSSTSIYSTTDPVLGSFTNHPLITAATAIGGFDHYLLYAQTISSQRQELRMTNDGFVTAPTFVAREPVTTSVYSHIAASPLNQLLYSTAASLTLSGRV